MISSMTGYGKGTAGRNNIKIEVEVKSVNSRYLDIFLKLPSALFNKEYELKEEIRKKVARGKLSVLIQTKRNGRSDNIPDLDKDKLKEYISFIKAIKKATKITEKIKLEHLLIKPELFARTEEEYSEQQFELIKKALNSALNQLLKMKESEGKELAKDLTKRVGIIEKHIEVVEHEYQGSIKEYHDKLKERIKSLVNNISEYNDRLELELALIADRADISEECTRLKSHIKFFKESLSLGDEPGRKLNFLCQEMNREANTISSKSYSTILTHNAVLIKEEIEKIREQIQNIE
jgi:uncharacterized protein (TIGR00255 family)